MSVSSKSTHSSSNSSDGPARGRFYTLQDMDPSEIEEQRAHTHISFPPISQYSPPPLQIVEDRHYHQGLASKLNHWLTDEDMPVVELPVFKTTEERQYSWTNQAECEGDDSEEEENLCAVMIEGGNSSKLRNPVHPNAQPTNSKVQVESKQDPSKHDKSQQDQLPPKPSQAVKAFHERHHFEFTVIVMGGAALAFNAGFVNGCTYQLGNTPVSHITGTTTKSGLRLGEGDFEGFAIYLCLIISFMFGAMISGYMMRQETFQLGREYGPLFIIGSLLFLVACLSINYAPETNLFFYFAAMACGLQNGLTTKYSGSIIRTTHMTGAGTDIGLVIGRILYGDTKERWKLFVLCPLFVMFLLGGVMSVFAVRRLGKLSLLINVIVFSSIGIAYSIIVGQELHIPFWRALFGLYIVVEKKIVDSHIHAKNVVKQVVDKVKSPLHE